MLPENSNNLMERFLYRFQRIIIIFLLVLMVFVIALSSIELLFIIIEEIASHQSKFLLDINQLQEIFGFFLMILIGLELIETMKVYLAKASVHVEIIFLVALIAITRKVIILDIHALSALTLIGVASIIIALTVGYYILIKALKFKNEEE